MKKIFVSFIVVFITVLFCSCGIPAQKQECFSVPENFICDLSVVENEVGYECSLERKDGVYFLKVISPESMNGLCAEYKDGEINASFSESEIKFMPKETFFLSDIVEYLENPDNNEIAVLSADGSAYIIENENWKLSFPKA